MLRYVTVMMVRAIATPGRFFYLSSPDAPKKKNPATIQYFSGSGYTDQSDKYMFFFPIGAT